MTNYLTSFIKDYIDFPKKGIIFKDILPVLQKPDVFLELINKMSSSEMILNSDGMLNWPVDFLYNSFRMGAAWSAALASWSAKMINTIDGGIICPSVPDAQIVPVARDVE